MISAQDNLQSCNDNTHYDTIIDETHFESHTLGQPFNSNNDIRNSKNNYFFGYKKERDCKDTFECQREQSNRTGTAATRDPSSKTDEHQFAKLHTTYGKTAGTNSGNSATANNHRKNLKLRQQNMDHDYR